MKKIIFTLLVLFGAIAQVSADDTWTVAGAPASLFGSEWAPTDTNNDMTDTDEDGIYTWEKKNVSIAASTNIEFKVATNHSWDNPSYPGGNYQATISNAGNYDITITFNSSSHEVNFTATAIIGTVKLAGSFNDWSGTQDYIELSKVNDTNVYTCDIDTWTADNVEFKLIANDLWMGYTDVTSIDAPDGWVVDSGEYHNFKLKHSTTNYKSYTITATWDPNKDANQKWDIKIEGKEVKINTVKLAGSFNSWSGTTDYITLSKVGDTNSYTCDVDWSNQTDFKLIANDLWMGYDDVTSITAPDGWVVKDSYGNFQLKGRSFTHYLSYTITATWTPNKYANQGWAISIVGKEAQPYTTNTVTYVDGNGWENVYAYIYPNTDYVAWHGTDITSTKSTTTIGGNSYNVYTFNYNVYEGGTAPTNIIFNDGGSTQSPDYELVAGKQYRYGLPAGKYVLVGSNNTIFPSGWTAENSTQELTDNGDGTYSYTLSNIDLNANDLFEFKVVDIANSVLVYYPSADNVSYKVYDKATYDFDIAFNPTTPSVDITGKRHVAIDAAGFTSFSSAHYLDWSTVENAAPYMATLTGEAGNKKALLSKVTATNAGQGALIKGTPNAIAKPVIASVTNTFVGNLFVATDGTAISGSTDGSYNYVYSAAPNPGFYKLTSNLAEGKVKANGAYLHTTEPLAEEATSRVSWIFDDEVTGINQIENTQPATVKNTVVYNLNGQRVMNPAKGLYIVNGKKVIIK